MSELAFKHRLAIAHFGAHSGIVFVCLLLMGLHKLSFGEVLPILSVVAPVVAVYAPAIVRFVIDNRFTSNKKGARLTTSFITFSIATFVACHLVIYGMVATYALTGIMTPSQFQSIFGTIEVFFALYLGAIMRDLFKS